MADFDVGSGFDIFIHDAGCCADGWSPGIYLTFYNNEKPFDIYEFSCDKKYTRKFVPSFYKESFLKNL